LRKKVLKNPHESLKIFISLHKPIAPDPVWNMVPDPVPEMVPDLIPEPDLFPCDRSLQNDAVCSTNLTEVAIAISE
jgi:hypothetical protein